MPLRGHPLRRAGARLRGVLESFFALLAAAIQAPQYPVAWLTLYRTDQLRSLVRKLRDGGAIMSRLGAPLSWQGIADELLQFQLDDRARDRNIKAAFAAAWSRFAHDFLDPTLQDEYNNMKHGLRIAAGGFALSFGLEHTPGVPPPREEMTPPRGSPFGSTYYEVVRLAPDNVRIERHSRNWNPVSLAWGVEFLALSMTNFIAFLQVRGGTPADEVQFQWPADLDDLKKPWLETPSFISSSFNTTIRLEDIRPRSKREIRRSYRTER